MRNFFRSRPWPISFKVKKPLLISYLSERAMFTIVSSGIVTSGMFGGDLIKYQQSVNQQIQTLVTAKLAQHNQQ
jgi:hypothetical protein